MPLSFEVRVACIADLAHVDARVRAICNTTTGAQCQSLLTTEYQNWRRSVARSLLPPSALADYSTPTVTDAYLSGMRLRFVAPMCTITQSLPHALAVHAHDLRKRKLSALDVSVDQL